MKAQKKKMDLKDLVESLGSKPKCLAKTYKGRSILKKDYFPFYYGDLNLQNVSEVAQVKYCIRGYFDAIIDVFEFKDKAMLDEDLNKVPCILSHKYLNDQEHFRADALFKNNYLIFIRTNATESSEVPQVMLELDHKIRKDLINHYKKGFGFEEITSD